MTWSLFPTLTQSAQSPCYPERAKQDSLIPTPCCFICPECSSLRHSQTDFLNPFTSLLRCHLIREDLVNNNIRLCRQSSSPDCGFSTPFWHMVCVEIAFPFHLGVRWGDVTYLGHRLLNESDLWKHWRICVWSSILPLSCLDDLLETLPPPPPISMDPLVIIT